MRVLAIDTSNLVLSVAVVEEERVLAEMTTNQQKKPFDSADGLRKRVAGCDRNLS